ncbi:MULTISPECIES: VOC family protein [Streptomyces]|uniref:Glyoxalase-like domain-containing protein n=1 Tax=Streptomyces sviceus (strain ATCC 29083 / DSM 924 / JCM 4929 / NBRC 13980 / NCIMB 11184 / NRRL 5439 / UC 5370) TaxID=463191 RepID=B5I7S7_STRX2|nr:MULTISPECIES: VOC family protein [Streptomyces]EDY61132.1 conserved hypothetical protein [Streptomyces sviceus ATCC 29083]MYT09664.1 hypothetical protein [Streptomyces sp. SID5470]
MARLGDVAFDCAGPAMVARSGAAALDGCAVAPYDDEELARRGALGITGVEDEAERLVGLGATVRERYADRLVLCDPEGSESCVTPT